MKEDTKITQQDIDEAKVSLKPILGITPGHYLAALFATILSAIAFIVLVLPGIRNNGRYYDFKVDPLGSAIYVNGVYQAYSPCSVFLPAGESTILITRPGFENQKFSVNSKGRILGSLFLPSRSDVSLELLPVGGNTILEKGMAQYASWALSGTPSESYQIPLVLSEAAMAATIEPGSLAPKGFAGTALSYTRHAQSLRDASRAITTAYGKSATIGPLVLGRIVGALVSELEDDPAMLAAFAASAPMELRKKLEQSDYYIKSMTALKHRRENATQAVRGAQLSVAGMSFVSFGPGTAVVNAHPYLPAVVELGAFQIAASETTNAEFKRFIAENPAWSRESRAVLEKEGLVDSDYLMDMDSASGSRPIRYVSKPAAEAYCEWLSTSAPPGYRITLPTEAQWSYVASAAGSSASHSAILQESGREGPVPPSSIMADSAGMKGLLGNVWEWCADPYAIQPASGLAGRIAYPYSEYVVRGACWANRADLVSLDSRGPMSASTCSAYLGFRVVLVPESE